MAKRKGSSGDDRRLAIAEHAFERLKAADSPPTPRSFEVWFSVANGDVPALRDAVQSIVDTKGRVDEQDIEALFEAHIAPRSFAAHAERTSRGVLAEIDHVMEMIDLALGSSAKYGESLVSLTNDLSGTVDRNRIRDIVGALVLATREAAATNKTLDARLKETRNEISTLRETLEAVRIEALTDAVTGLANRKHFEEMLVKWIDQVSIVRQPMSLIMIDIDRFKHFNDTFGHLTGDQVLRLVGATMREKVKLKATIARFGGEEFAVILPDTTLDGARALAEAIRLGIMGRELIKRSTGESLGRVTVSCGVAQLTRGDTVATLLERADACLLLAKRTGRNRTVVESDVIQDDGELPEQAVA